MNKFDYLKPTSVDEAISLFGKQTEAAKYIAGGTDVMVKIKDGKIKPGCLISLRHLQGLDHLTYEDGELRIGAMVTHRMLELSPVIRKEFPILTDAVENIGSVQVRNVATIGGNIVNAVPSADGAIPLITLGAEIRIRGPEGERAMPLEDLFVGPGETVLRPGEILSEFVIPRLPSRTGGAYCKHTRRAAMELPLLGVAVMVSLEDDMLTCTRARIGLGVLAPTPMRARNAEATMEGQALNDQTLKKAGEAAAAECKARDTIRCAAWYRRDMVKVLVPRMAKVAIQRASK
ncbi:MAG: FAD binding domain-containing protein [Pseudomonadota bacterium]|nr:FAD binding domain-containing protein [Desulfobacterales bacterium]MBL6967764.1 FAD binding domain-containing protein [Desulfobacteraceae bacterium]MBL7101473.1 FAD binding domain-containing protein [Desulfobacteraceae bacterium]MBL7171800.1 FAD binding domain-containing protein [Desulfobacteraceae bacterium]MBU0735697.1 FAD binding domain-containing protein [Pseudomonadota bacterium]